MFTHLEPALERIAFQANSALAKGLITLCQQAIDHGSADKFSAFSKRCEALILKEVGIKSRVNVKPMGMLYAAVAPIIGDDIAQAVSGSGDARIKEIINARNRMIGATHNTTVGQSLQDICDRMSYGLNVTTGKVDASARDLLGADIILSTELFHPIHGGEDPLQMTPEEIAALITHEIGHVVGDIENFRNGFYRSLEARDSIQLLAAQGTPEGLVNLVADTKTRVANVPDAKRREGYQTLLKNAEQSKPVEAQAEIASYIALDIVTGQTLAVLTLIALSPIILPRQIFKIVHTRLIKEAVAAAAIALGAGTKTSDILNTLEQNASMRERTADEFASRHGLGRFVASALRKLYIAESPALYYGAGSGTVAHLLAGYASIAIALFPPPMIIPGAHPYDAPIRRALLLLENNMAIFKSGDLPRDVRDHWISETEIMMKNIADAKKQGWPELHGEFIWGALLRLSSAGSIIGMLANANLQKDYSKLQDLTRRLIRNPLYFRAAQIQQKIDSSKD